MKLLLRSIVVLGVLLTVGSCGGSGNRGPAASDADASGQLDSAQGRDMDVADKETQSCVAVTRPESCTAESPACILDLRAVRASFPTCRTGYAWLPFVVSCGGYDGVVYAGIDSATTYYFDHLDGHLVGFTNTGLTTLAPCGAFDPSFKPTACDRPDDCPPADAGPDV